MIGHTALAIDELLGSVSNGGDLPWIGADVRSWLLGTFLPSVGSRDTTWKAPVRDRLSVHEMLALLGRACSKVMSTRAPDEELCRAATGRPYLRRWWIDRRPASEASSSALYLHEILEPDMDPPHNHPWASASLVLSGVLSDAQHLPAHGGGTTIRRWTLRPGNVLYRPPSHCHLLVPRISPVITLFATGPRVQPWGFMRPDGTFGRDHGEHALRGRRAELDHPQTV